MTIDDQIKDEKIKINKKPEKYQPYHQTKLVSMNILLVEKHCLLIKKK